MGLILDLLLRPRDLRHKENYNYLLQHINQLNQYIFYLTKQISEIQGKISILVQSPKSQSETRKSNYKTRDLRNHATEIRNRIIAAIKQELIDGTPTTDIQKKTSTTISRASFYRFLSMAREQLAVIKT